MSDIDPIYADEYYLPDDDDIIGGKITYELSSTATSFTVRITKVHYSDIAVDPGTYTLKWTVTVGGSTVTSGTTTATASNRTINFNKSLSASKVFTRTTSAQSKVLSFTYQVLLGDYNHARLVTPYTKTLTVPALPTYHIQYIGNSSTGGSTSSQTKTHGQSITLRSCGYTRTNYVFKRWNTSRTDDGTAYNAGATYTTNNDLNLYAIWSPTIRFDANGGTSSSLPATQVKTYGSSMTLSTVRPIRTGYVFNHWNSYSNNTGTSYASGATISASDNFAKLLYAIWDPYIYYNANGGTGAPVSELKTYNASYTVSSVVPTRPGYKFDRWNTSKDGTGTWYSSGAAMSASQNSSVTLYAQWIDVSDPPTIRSLTVIRSNSSGVQDDMGHWCKVIVGWRIDTTCVSTNTGTVTGTITPENGSAMALTFSSGASGTSGTAVALFGSDNTSDAAYCDTDLQYVVTVTVTHSATDNPAIDRVTTRSDIMTRSHFIFDFKAGGRAIGIGSAAPASGLEVGWKTNFTDDVSMTEDLSVVGDVAFSTPLGIASGGTGTADFGKIESKLVSGLNISNSTYKSVKSVKLAKGTWIITYGTEFTANSTGYRRAFISTSADTNDSSAMTRSGMTVGAVNGDATHLNGAEIVSPTSETTYYLTAYQTSGGNLIVWNTLKAIRIC